MQGCTEVTRKTCQRRSKTEAEALRHAVACLQAPQLRPTSRRASSSQTTSVGAPGFHRVFHLRVMPRRDRFRTVDRMTANQTMGARR